MSSKEGKRKVGDTSLEGEGEIEKVFQKSKLVSRSPVRKQNNAKEMEQVLLAITQMRGEIKEEIKENFKTQNELFQAELEKTNIELKQIKEELKLKEGEWAKEKSNLQGRILDLENRMEREDKNRRRNNIVLKEVKLEGQNVKAEVEEFLRTELDTNVQIVEAYQIRNKVVIAKVMDWTQKKKIMENKGKLRGTNMFIDNDLTQKEMDTQKKLRDIARHEREKGNTAKVGYQKIIINDKLYNWEEIKNYQHGDDPQNSRTRKSSDTIRIGNEGQHANSQQLKN